MVKDKSLIFDKEKDNQTQYCIRAPEWAEHARFDENDEPCDDGRTGIICVDKNDEEPCPIR